MYATRPVPVNGWASPNPGSRSVSMFVRNATLPRLPAPPRCVMRHQRGVARMLWSVRSLEKLPLGTDYPKFADRNRDICFVLRTAGTRKRKIRLQRRHWGWSMRSATCSTSVTSTTYPAPSCPASKRTEHYPDTPKGWSTSPAWTSTVERVSLGKGYAIGRLLGIM